MSKNIILLYISISLCLVLVSCQEKLLVETTHGKISGKFLKTLNKVKYAGFMGIPFADAPIDNLRFTPPQDIEQWPNVLPTKKEQKPCAQFNQNVKKKQPMGFFGAENCLYLDIFTPAIDDAKRAVIVFIYNDHFINSYNKSKDYKPDFFIEEDVITVAISHRLSAFGFLSLEEKLLWGNAGIKDIVLGLKWVKNNIAKFGGDPEKITMMGVGGGASIVDLLLHSKKRNLFNSAILQSGSAWSSAILQENVRSRAFELAKLMGKTPVSSFDVLNHLIDVPAINITLKDLHASPSDHFKETQRAVAAFAPIIEKDPEGLIVDYPENSTEINTPIMMGFNSHEGMESSLHYFVEPRYMSFLHKDFPLMFPIRVNFRFDPLHEPMYEAIEEVKAFYFKKGINFKKVSDYVTYIGDVSTSYSIDYAAKRYAKISKSPLYYYHFEYSSDFNENKNNMLKLSTAEKEELGAAAGDELCYLFKCPDLGDLYLDNSERMSEEWRVQKKLVKLWTNFAKYGNPTLEDDGLLEGLKWPTYDLKNKQYLNIGKQMEIKQDLNKDRVTFWDNFIKKWGKKAVNGVIKDLNKKDEL